MAFSPNQSPIFGGGSVVVAFGASTRLASDARIYLIFHGQKRRHVVQAAVVNGQTLQANIPEHDRAESVRLHVCEDAQDSVKTLATTQFQFVLTDTHYLAEHLLNSVNTDLSDGLEEYNLEEDGLDERLVKAIGHLGVDKDWNVLGKAGDTPRETLLHLCARHRLRTLTCFLLRHPGGRAALLVRDLAGRRPREVLGSEDTVLARLLDPGGNCVADLPLDDEDRQAESFSCVNGLYSLSTSDSQLSPEDCVLLIRERLSEASDVDPPCEAAPPSQSCPDPPCQSQPRAQAPENIDTVNHSRTSDQTAGHDKNQSPDIRNSWVDNYSSLDVTPPTDSLNISADSLESACPLSQDSLERLSQIDERNSDSDIVEIDELPLESGADSLSGSVVTVEEVQIITSKDNAVAPVDSSGAASPETQKRVSVVAESASLLGAVIGVDISGNLTISESMDNVTTVQPADDVIVDNSDVTMDKNDGSRTEDGTSTRPRSKHSSSDHSIPEEELDSIGDLDDDAFRQQVSPPVRPSKLPETGGRGRQCQSTSSIPSIHVTSPHSTTTVIDNFATRIHSEGDATQVSGAWGERKDQLCRFSSSCPSLNEEAVPEEHAELSTSLNEKGGCHCSMVDIAQQQAQSSCPITYDVTDVAKDTGHSARVQICVNDVTVDTSVTERENGEEEGKVARTRSTLAVETEKTKKNKRRRSWCNTVPGKEQGQRRQHKLAVMGRSMSLSSLDSNDESSSSDDEDDDEDEEDEEEEYSEPVGASSPEYHRPPAQGTAHSLTDVRVSVEEHVTLRTASGQRAQSPDVGLNSSAILDLSSLTKSVSSPSIPSEDATQKVFTFDTSTEDVSSHRTPSMSASSGSQTFSPDRSREEVITPERYRPAQKFSPRTDVNGRASDGDDEAKEKPKKQRRHSVFSKLGSYRNKKIKEREQKSSKTTHQYVGVSFSNSTACDVCGKSMANKPAMQCQNCMANVHENTCKDQIAPCNKMKQFRSLSKQSTSFNQGPRTSAGAGLRLSQSIKEIRSAPVTKQALQPSNNMVSQRNPSPPGKMITEEVDDHKEAKDTPDGVTTNMVSAMSASVESLEDACDDITDLLDPGDIWLLAQDAEPEAWSITVDKKTLKKMTAKDIKRQDHIWELIMTEKHHCRTLKIMQKVFSKGMSVELGMNQELIDRIFPELDELIDIHLGFLQQLLERQGVRPDKMFEYLGDLLVNQFGYHNGERLKVGYGEFCRKHKEAVACYKDLLKNNRNFQNFIKKCSTNSMCRKLGIPECILLVTHRMTKYPIMIEYIMNTTKDREDRERLEEALRLTKEVLMDIDRQVGAYEREQRLLDIYHKTDARSTAVYKGNKFKKSDLLSSNRKLIYEGTVGWKPARGKPIEVIAVVLNDLIFFLQENNQKYTFFTHDNKSAVVSLHKLIVREKGDTRDSRGIYLISQNKLQPEMYELVCSRNDDFKHWISHLRSAIAECVAQGEDESPSRDVSEEESRDVREEEATSQQAQRLLTELETKDQVIYKACDEKIALVAEMMQLHTGQHAGIKIQEGVIDIDVEEVRKSGLDEVSRLESWLTQESVPVHLGRSISHQTPASPALPAMPLPKRAETFTAFDTSKTAIAAKRRGIYAVKDSQGRSTSLQNLNINKQELDGDLMLTVDMAKTWSMRRGSAGQNADSPEKKAQKEYLEDIEEEEARLRRMSTSILSFLAKQSSPQPDESKSPSPSPAHSPSAPSPSAPSPVPPSEEGPPKPLQNQREANHSLAHVSNVIKCLATLATRQHTELESKIIQLEQATKQANKLAETVRALQEKRSNFRHDQQLEELRNLQETIRKEKEEWERSKERDRLTLDSDREELGQQKQELDKRKGELKKEQDELQRQKEALQRQMDLHRLQVAQVQQQSQHLLLQQQQLQQQIQQRHETDQSLLQELEPQHKRSNSADSKDQGFEPMKPEYSQSLKEPLNRRQVSSEPRPRPVSEFSTQASKTNLPIHLYSATNEQKVGSIKQQLPMKLSQRMSSSGNLGNLVSMGSMKHSNSSPTTGGVTTHPTLARLASASNLNHSHSQRHSTTSAGLLPMKLAETSKRVSSPTSENKPKKDQKFKEDPIIYF